MPQYRMPKPGSEFYVPPAEYRAVVNFCQCYDGWKMRLAIINATIDAYDSKNATVSGVQYDGMPHGTDVSDPTGNEATRNTEEYFQLIHERDRVAYKIKIIEKVTRRICDDACYPYVMDAITHAKPYYKLEGIPLSDKAFGKLRRRVYYEIAKLI